MLFCGGLGFFQQHGLSLDFEVFMLHTTIQNSRNHQDLSYHCILTSLVTMEQVVKHPMDFGTIRDRMDAKDGTGYKHIQEICDDVRLVFSNATSYNQDGSDVHTMAKTLSDKFEEKWKALVEPKLAEEEAKRKQEDKEAQTKEDAAIQAADEAAAERMADDFARQVQYW
jgi:hypothetical protein